MPKAEKSAEKSVESKKGKLRVSILPMTFWEEVMKVGEFGAEKHGDNTYKKIRNRVYYLDAAFRHFFVCYVLRKEITDPESGLHHLAHAVWNLLAVMEIDYEDTVS